MRWWLVFLMGCGRLGFDARITDGTPADLAPPDPTFVLSVTQLVPSTAFSFVALAVDWPRKLAYIGTREVGHCVAVVDFANEQVPVIARYLDPPGDTTCLDVALLDDTHLAILSLSGNRVTTWSLGADPHVGLYTALGQITIASPRHFTLDRAQDALLVVTGGDPALVDVAFDAGFNLTATAMWTGTCAMAYQAAAAFGGFVAVACQDDHATIELLLRAGLVSAGTPIVDDGAGTTGFWRATVSPDGTRAFMLGWVNAALSDANAAIVVDGKWRQPDTQPYRGARMVDATRLWTAVADGAVELLSATEIGHVVGRGSLGGIGEAYDLDIDLGRQRGIAVTNKGSFVVIDPTRIPSADFTWPAN